MEERLSAAPQARSGELLLDLHGGVATVALNRPAALNALSWDMVAGLAECLDAWEADDHVRIILLRGAGGRAFCAGGDIRMFYEEFRATGHGSHDFFTREYALDFRIHTYPKPIVAVMDGIVMGGGMGIAQGAALRVVTDATRMAMPETAIGLFPDVGGSYFLSRAPGRIGEYLALAGPTIGAADAVCASLADAHFAPAALSSLDARLAEAAHAKDVHASVKAMAAAGERGSASATLPPLRHAIDRHFAAPTVEAIVETLEHERDHPEWARTTREAILRNAPTALKVTLEQIRRGRTLSLADCFRMELGLVRNALDHGDFFEGIRAAVIDKDRKPRWNPPRLEDVTPEAVERHFQSRWSPAQHPLSHLTPTRNP